MTDSRRKDDIVFVCFFIILFGMEIRQYICNIVDSNSWLLVENNNGLLIDAIESFDLFNDISKLNELTIILTHSHFDHILGLNKIRELIQNVKVISTEKCSKYICNEHKNMSSNAMVYMMFYKGKKNIESEISPFVCDKANEVFEEKLMFNWEGHNLNLVSVHGHSDDSLILTVDNEFVFSGDSLLNIPTVTRLPRGNTRRFWEEDIPIIKNMNNIKTVFPGHGLPGNIKDMLAVNIPPQNL